MKYMTYLRLCINAFVLHSMCMCMLFCIHKLGHVHMVVHIHVHEYILYKHVRVHVQLCILLHCPSNQRFYKCTMSTLCTGCNGSWSKVHQNCMSIWFFHFLHSFQNPDSIVMTIDMHLTLPTGFVEYIRRVGL